MMTPTEPSKPTPRSVLVVDDDAAVGRSIGRVLGAAGFDVTTAGDGSVAIRALEKRSFDVILSDIQMPDLSGMGLLSAIRAQGLEVPVILMTGDPQLETAIEAVSLGATQYLVKPIANVEVVKAVERASWLHRMAKMKRDAYRLLGEGALHVDERVALNDRFDNALTTLFLAFQPIVESRTGRVFAYEALMRSGERSLPHPGAVIDAAERLDRLPELGRRVRDLAAEAFAKAPPDVLLFVNLHTRDLLDPALYEAGAPLTRIADRVVLEITERTAIDDISDVRVRVNSLRRHGYRIAIDDLGAGYAGLSSFVALEPEIVKLDMSLVRDVHTSPLRQRLVGSMAGLCREMGLRVVAEGVEIPEERDCMIQFGCDLLQGYLFAKPGPPFAQVAPW